MRQEDEVQHRSSDPRDLVVDRPYGRDGERSESLLDWNLGSRRGPQGISALLLPYFTVYRGPTLGVWVPRRLLPQPRLPHVHRNPCRRGGGSRGTSTITTTMYSSTRRQGTTGVQGVLVRLRLFSRRTVGMVANQLTGCSTTFVFWDCSKRILGLRVSNSDITVLGLS